MVIRFACEPTTRVNDGDAFTHITARFPKGQLLYPEVPPPRGIIVEAVDDTTLSIRCAEVGTVYVVCGDWWSPFGSYLRNLSRPGVQVLVAQIYFDNPERIAWVDLSPDARVKYVPEIALAMGGPEVHVQEYENYPHKNKPHRLVVPAGCNVVCNVNNNRRWSCTSTFFHTLYPRGMPMHVLPHAKWTVKPSPQPEPNV